MIREYTVDDVIYIEQIGALIKHNFKLKLNDFSKCLVYEDNNIIVGFIVVSMIYETAEIIDTAVMDEYQRKGIGSELLVSVNSECLDKGCSSIMLEVRSSNEKAILFYKKHGFKKVMVRQDYYTDREEAIIMEKLVI